MLKVAAPVSATLPPTVSHLSPVSSRDEPSISVSGIWRLAILRSPTGYRLRHSQSYSAAPFRTPENHHRIHPTARCSPPTSPCAAVPSWTYGIPLGDWACRCLRGTPELGAWGLIIFALPMVAYFLGLCNPYPGGPPCGRCGTHAGSPAPNYIFLHIPLGLLRVLFPPSLVRWSRCSAYFGLHGRWALPAANVGRA